MPGPRAQAGVGEYLLPKLMRPYSWEGGEHVDYSGEGRGGTRTGGLLRGQRNGGVVVKNESTSRSTMKRQEGKGRAMRFKRCVSSFWNTS